MDTKTRKTLHKNIHPVPRRKLLRQRQGGMRLLGREAWYGVHHPHAKLPKYCHHSKFFSYAAKIEQMERNLTTFAEAKRTAFQAKGTLLTIVLRLPQFPKGVLLPKVFVLDTPENNAMTIGRLKMEPDGRIHFELARFHTGVAAQQDLTIAMQQAVRIPDIKNLVTALDDPPSEMFLCYITREGHLTDWHKAIWETTRIDIPTTIVHAEHVAGDVSANFGRITKICPINFEGMTPAKTRVLVLSDNTASGIQHVAVLEEILSHIKKVNRGKHHVKQIFIVSPLLTIYGASIISLWAAREEGISSTFVTSGALLGCNPPDRYFSPLTAEKNLIANPNLIAINHQAHGKKAAGRACVRGNWTASFMAPPYAMVRSKEELALYGSSNSELLKNSQNITLQVVKDAGVDPTLLIPFSTQQQAAYLGKNLLY